MNRDKLSKHSDADGMALTQGLNQKAKPETSGRCTLSWMTNLDSSPSNVPKVPSINALAT